MSSSWLRSSLTLDACTLSEVLHVACLHGADEDCQQEMQGKHDRQPREGAEAGEARAEEVSSEGFINSEGMPMEIWGAVYADDPLLQQQVTCQVAGAKTEASTCGHMAADGAEDGAATGGVINGDAIKGGAAPQPSLLADASPLAPQAWEELMLLVRETHRVINVEGVGVMLCFALCPPPALSTLCPPSALPSARPLPSNPLPVLPCHSFALSPANPLPTLLCRPFAYPVRLTPTAPCTVMLVLTACIFFPSSLPRWIPLQIALNTQRQVAACTCHVSRCRARQNVDKRKQQDDATRPEAAWTQPCLVPPAVTRTPTEAPAQQAQAVPEGFMQHQHAVRRLSAKMLSPMQVFAIYCRLALLSQVGMLVACYYASEQVPAAAAVLVHASYLQVRSSSPPQKPAAGLARARASRQGVAYREEQEEEDEEESNKRRALQDVGAVNGNEMAFAAARAWPEDADVAALNVKEWISCAQCYEPVMMVYADCVISLFHDCNDLDCCER
jgi:hypothetical protein